MQRLRARARARRVQPWAAPSAWMRYALLQLPQLPFCVLGSWPAPEHCMSCHNTCLHMVLPCSITRVPQCIWQLATCCARVQAKGVQQGVLLAGVLGAALLLASMGRPDVQEVSFQHFRTHLLANGLVDHIEVTNKSTAKVFVRPGSQRCAFYAGHAWFSSVAPA